MKVIGISGAQGGGKSTLLEQMKVLGYKVDDFKVSRAVQSELGWESLTQVTASIDTMIDFQSRVLEAKAKNDRRLKEQGDGVILVERTFADIYAYTCLWIKKQSHDQRSLIIGTEFLRTYGNHCWELQDEIYSGVVLLPFMSHVAWVDDLKRGAKDDTDTVFDSVVSFCQLSHVPNIKIKERNTGERADEVLDFIRSIK